MRSKSLESLKKKYQALSDKREVNINKYIIPIELKMSELEEAILEMDPKWKS